MASKVYVPSILYVEAAPTYLFRDLPVQHQLLTPASGHSDIRVQPESSVSSPKYARELARIVHAHYGTIPDEFKDVMAGGVTHTNGVKTVSHESKAFRVNKLNAIISSVHREKTGSASFFQAYVRGVVCTDNMKLGIRNYTIEAHICTMPVANEDAQARARRLALGAAYTAAVSDIRTLWVQTYTNAFNRELDLLAKLGSDKPEYALCHRQVALLKNRMENPPTAGINVAMLNNVEQARSALMVPLFSRPADERSVFWKHMFDVDTFASFFKESKSIVDLRRLHTDSARHDMWSNLWAKSCDIFARMVLPLEIATTELCVYSDDVIIRASCNFNDPSQTKKVFKNIRGLFDEMQYSSKGLVWDGVPILGPGLRGTKRGLGDEMMMAGSNDLFVVPNRLVI